MRNGLILRLSVRSLIALLLLAAAPLLTSCGEKDVPYIIDAEEITRFINEDVRAVGLFEWQTMFVPDPYTVPFDSGIYRDSVLKHQRSIDVEVSSDPDAKVDWGALGELRQAYAGVDDVFDIQRTRVYTDTTIVDTVQRLVVRWGFFLKLGDDAEDYAGWMLWGFRGLQEGSDVGLGTVRVGLYDGTSFAGDLSAFLDRPPSEGLPGIEYARLDEMPEVVMGSRVVVEVTRSAGSTPTYHLLSGLDTSGAFQHEMLRLDTLSLDTIRVPYYSQNPPVYGLLHFQRYRSSDGGAPMYWSIPFRYKR